MDDPGQLQRLPWRPLWCPEALVLRVARCLRPADDPDDSPDGASEEGEMRTDPRGPGPGELDTCLSSGA